MGQDRQGRRAPERRLDLPERRHADDAGQLVDSAPETEELRRLVARREASDERAARRPDAANVGRLLTNSAIFSASNCEHRSLSDWALWTSSASKSKNPCEFAQ